MTNTRDFSEERDPLEDELAALSPREPSPQLRERIARQLSPSAPRRWPPLAAAALAGAIAASLLATAWLWPRGSDGKPGQFSGFEEPLVSTALDDRLPSVWSYRAAVTGSANELDALLDRHAPWSAASAAGPYPIQAWTRFDHDLSNIPGEL